LPSNRQTLLIPSGGGTADSGGIKFVTVISKINSFYQKLLAVSQKATPAISLSVIMSSN